MNRRRFTNISFAALLATLTTPRVSAMAAGPAKTFEVTKTADEWRKVLSKEAFTVMREHGTERAGTSPLDKVTAAGMYNCAACDLPLFSSETKYDSGTGWPSFWKPLDNAVGESQDNTLFTTRTEIHPLLHERRVAEIHPQSSGLDRQKNNSTRAPRNP
jgi:peptide-methionine (R)-S-oxide reductase